jgi:hypothetical protein
MTDDASYLRERARVERERASTCEDSVAALVHLRMADEYDKRAKAANTLSKDGDKAQRTFSPVAHRQPNVSDRQVS